MVFECLVCISNLVSLLHLLKTATEKTAIDLLCCMSIVLVLIVVSNKCFLNNNFILLSFLKSNY